MGESYGGVGRRGELVGELWRHGIDWWNRELVSERTNDTTLINCTSLPRVYGLRGRRLIGGLGEGEWWRELWQK